MTRASVYASIVLSLVGSFLSARSNIQCLSVYEQNLSVKEQAEIALRSLPPALLAHPQYKVLLKNLPQKLGSLARRLAKMDLFSNVRTDLPLREGYLRFTKSGTVIEHSIVLKAEDPVTFNIALADDLSNLVVQKRQKPYFTGTVFRDGVARSIAGVLLIRGENENRAIWTARPFGEKTIEIIQADGTIATIDPLIDSIQNPDGTSSIQVKWVNEKTAFLIKSIEDHFGYIADAKKFSPDGLRARVDYIMRLLTRFHRSVDSALLNTRPK